MNLDVDLCQVVGESADRLVQPKYSCRRRRGLTTRNITKELYEAARAQRANR